MDLFVDTSSWCALYDPTDQFHQKATNFWRQLQPQPIRLITSEYVLDETYTLLRMRAGLTPAIAFHDLLSKSQILGVIEIDEDIRSKAWYIFTRYTDKDFSFTDCTSFAIMDQLGLTQAFAFDDHFTQYGFVCLPS